ncbi:MAG: porin family protein, partial [Mariniphaga sp.]
MIISSQVLYKFGLLTIISEVQMKKMLLIAVVFLCAVGLSAKGNMSYGFKAAAGIVNISDGTNSIGPKLGISLGGIAKVKIAPIFTLQCEALLAFKGASSADTPPVKFNLTYLDIPILAKLTFGDNAIFVGPYLGLKLGATVEQGGASATASGVSSTDFGVVFGFERFFTRNIAIDFRVNWGLSKIASDGSDIKNIGMMFGFG